MDKIWKAKWIMDPEFHGLTPINLFHKELNDPELPEHRDDLKNHHMLIRKEFLISDLPQRSIIDITADDYYKLYINGSFVGQGPAPAYYFHYNYNRYDITEFLKKGKNVVAVHVYYQGLINRVWNSGDYRQGMKAEIYGDEKLLLKTDNTWKYKISEAWGSGEVIGYKTQFLENFDSRLYDKYWQEIDYEDDDWDNVFEHISDDHKLYLQETPPLDIYEVKPELVKKLDAGHYFIDFGQEITGQFMMKAAGDEGEAIEIRCGEELIDNTEDRVRFEMRCNCKYQENWTLSGQDSDLLEFFDYKAFRYVEVIGKEDTIDEKSFGAVVRHYPLNEDKECKLESSDTLLNQIWDICKNGVKYGAQEGFLDCPTREKGQYLGDATVTGHSHIYLSGDLRLFKKAIEDFAFSTYVSSGMMAVAPGALMQEIADYSLQWPMQLLRYYQHSGDLQFLKKMYPACEKLLEYFDKYRRQDGLLEGVTEKWNLVDWPENLRDGYDFELSRPIGPGCHNVINAFYCGMVKDINKIRNILGIKYEDRFDDLRSAFIDLFYSEEKRLFKDSVGSDHSALHSNVLPLLYGLTPMEAKNNIVDFIAGKGLKCGVYMSYFVLKALANVEEYDLIFNIITNNSEYSWANMIREGATTCFEAWGKEQKWNTSLCHAWASAPIPVLIEDIIGLTPAKPGWEEIDFNPNIPEFLEHINLVVSVKSGKIKVKKKKDQLTIETPTGVKVNNG